MNKAATFTAWACCALLGCGAGQQSGSSDDDESAGAGFEECEGVARRANSFIGTAQQDTLQCTSDAECYQEFELPEGCWDHVRCSRTMRGNLGFRSAVSTAATGAASEACEEFVAKRCKPFAPSCPVTSESVTDYTYDDRGICVANTD